MDDVCHTEVRYMPLKCTHEELCESANDLFKTYAGLCNLIIKRNRIFECNLVLRYDLTCYVWNGILASNRRWESWELYRISNSNWKFFIY